MFNSIKKLFGLDPRSALERDVELANVDGRLHPGTIHYVLIWVKHDSLEELPARVSTIINYIAACDGAIISINCCFIVATFGMVIRSQPHARSNLESAVRLLAEKEGASLKIVYGSEPGLFGCLGSNEVLQYGPLLPDYTRRIETLLQLEWGKQVEIGRTFVNLDQAWNSLKNRN